ncbi:MAG: hypothetical protein CMO32_16565 [Variovorax sp.]|nr:hypothetical protein [Variovorax sp.]
MTARERRSIALDESTQESLARIRIALLAWFKRTARDFVWRRDRSDEYLLVVSEVLLQRTQAGVVNDFLPAFLLRYPSWERLARTRLSTLERVLKPLGLWRRRAEVLKALSRERVRLGAFPSERAALETLPGVGQYVANAIELHVYGRHRPLLDSSMARVLERCFSARHLVDIRFDPWLQSLSHALVDNENSCLINWAILDVAALICQSRSPHCAICPLLENCNFGRVRRSTQRLILESDVNSE